jgi:hypothetical protein
MHENKNVVMYGRQRIEITSHWLYFMHLNLILRQGNVWFNGSRNALPSPPVTN